MKRKMLLMVLIGVFLASPVLADTFLGSAGGVWTAMPTTDPNDHNPFWDNSGDGVNAGLALQTGLGGFPSGAGGQYWSLPTGLNDPNVAFLGSGGGQTQTLLLEVAGNEGSNELWVYNVADTTQRKLIFLGSDSATKTVAIPITYAKYGFALVNGSTEFDSTSSANFAFFQDPALSGAWWVGVEDLAIPGADKDYNDMIFKVSTVPLPPSALLLVSGLAGLGLMGWRRRKNAA